MTNLVVNKKHGIWAGAILSLVIAITLSILFLITYHATYGSTSAKVNPEDMTLEYNDKTYYLFEKYEKKSGEVNTPLGVICDEGKRVRFFHGFNNAVGKKEYFELCMSNEDIQRFDNRMVNQGDVTVERVEALLPDEYKHCVIKETIEAAIRTAEAFESRQMIYERLKKSVGGEKAIIFYEVWPDTPYEPLLSKCRKH